MDRNRPPRAILPSLILAAAAWSGASSLPTTAASEAIDTTLDAPSAPATASLGSTATSESDSVFDDSQPFENVVDPGATNERHWSFGISTSKSWVSRDTTSRSHSSSISRTSTWGPVSLSPHLGMSWLDETPGGTADKSLSAGAKFGASPFEDHTISLDATWITQRGPDAWESTASWSFDHDLADWFAFQLGANGGWSKDYRGSAQASLGGDAYIGAFDLSLAGSYARRYESYLDLVGNGKTSYVNVWGGSTGLSWTHGHWITGPSWSGETWKANTTASTQPVEGKNLSSTQRKLLRQASKVPASGIVLSQSLGWNTSWKPLPGIRFELDLLKNFGSSSSAVTAKKAIVQNYAAAHGQDPAFPDNSFGGTFGLSLIW